MYLESHMFHKMSDAIVFGVFVSAASVNPDTYSSCGQTRVLGSHTDTYNNHIPSETTRMKIYSKVIPEFRVVTLVGGTLTNV